MLKKKITSLIVILALVLTMVPFASAADSEIQPEAAEPTFPQYEANKFMMTELGLYTFINKEPGQIVSRAEFAQAMCDLMGWSELAQSEQEPYPFVDIKDTTPHKNAVITTIKYGIMSGINGVEFNPDGKITYMQAVKTVVCALGYGAFAQKQGGYPSGYLKYARELDILVSGANLDEELTFDMMLKLFKEALKAKVLETVGYANTKGIYEQNEDRYLLNVYHSIYLVTGVMSDNGYTSIKGDSEVKKGNAVVNGVAVEQVKDYAIDLIGYQVDMYYKDSNNDKVFMYAEKTTKNKDTVINAKELLPTDKDFNKASIAYKRDGRRSTVKISQYADLIYNGKAYKDFTHETFDIKSGTITCVDADHNGVSEIVVVDEYVDIYTVSVSKDNHTISSNYHSAIRCDDFDRVVFYDTEGAIVPYESIPLGCVLSVYESKDETQIKAIISTDVAEMEVKTIDKEDEGKIVVSGQEHEYRLSSTLLDKINDPTCGIEMPELRRIYKFYQNFEGDCAMVTPIGDKYEYAYLLAVGKGSGFTFDAGQMKVVLETGDCVDINTDKKVMYNKEPGLYDGRDIENIEAFYNSEGKFKPQLIKMKRNRDGEVEEIETATDNKKNPMQFDNTKFTLDYEGRTDVYTGKEKSIFGYYCYNDNTKIFLIKGGSAVTETTEPDEVKVVTAKQLGTSINGVTWKVYDMDEQWNISAMVGSAPGSYDDYCIVIKEAKVVKDENGDERVQVQCWWKDHDIWSFRENKPGVFKAALEKAGYDDMCPRKGDMFRICFDLSQELSGIEFCASPYRSTPDNTNVKPLSSMFGAVQATIAGAPIFRTDRRIGVLNTDGTFYATSALSDMRVIYLNIRDKSIKEVSYDDIPIVGSYNEDGTYSVNDDSVKLFIYKLRGGLCSAVLVQY